MKNISRRFIFFAALFVCVLSILAIYSYLYPRILFYPEDFVGPRTHFDPYKVPPAPDYSQPDNWMFTPKNPDQFSVDVFWVYPTVYMSTESWNMPLDDQETREKAKTATLKMIGVFKDSTNVYAPYYRQAGGACLSAIKSDKDGSVGVGIDDTTEAFKYYLKNLNNGKPFILAGHSQGSNVLIEMMKDLFVNEEISNKLVAAYIIGWSVTGEDLKKYTFLRIADTPDFVGGIITYNTVADGFQDKAPTILPGAMVVNPLPFSTSEALAPASSDIAAVIIDDNLQRTVIPNFTSAQIKNSALIIPRLKNEDKLDLPFGPGIYHNYDYSFFFENIRKNVKERIKSFFHSSLQ
ncbi:MAG: DUF3089 domain-containing protein [Candidatus Saganbacteria bacterium]|nr:DUF3089 domain-containing protein [Candidatus Saganbacteria bacterium]